MLIIISDIFIADNKRNFADSGEENWECIFGRTALNFPKQ